MSIENYPWDDYTYYEHTSCSNGHKEITYRNAYSSDCPLCSEINVVDSFAIKEAYERGYLDCRKEEIARLEKIVTTLKIKLLEEIL